MADFPRGRRFYGIIAEDFTELSPKIIQFLIRQFSILNSPNQKIQIPMTQKMTVDKIKN